MVEGEAGSVTALVWFFSWKQRSDGDSPAITFPWLVLRCPDRIASKILSQTQAVIVTAVLQTDSERRFPQSCVYFCPRPCNWHDLTEDLNRAALCKPLWRSHTSQKGTRCESSPFGGQYSLHNDSQQPETYSAATQLLRLNTQLPVCPKPTKETTLLSAARLKVDPKRFLLVHTEGTSVPVPGRGQVPTYILEISVCMCRKAGLGSRIVLQFPTEISVLQGTSRGMQLLGDVDKPSNEETPRLQMLPLLIPPVWEAK